jgi:hypothetical protein
MYSPIPPYLTLVDVGAGVKVAVCAPCRTSVAASQAPRHLRDYHEVNRPAQTEIVDYLVAEGLAAEPSAYASSPADGTPAIAALPVLDGFLCVHTDSCSFRTTSREGLERHAREEHGLAAPVGRPKKALPLVGGEPPATPPPPPGSRPVLLQTLYTQNPLRRLFVVTKEQPLSRRDRPQGQRRRPSASSGSDDEATGGTPSDSDSGSDSDGPDARAALFARFEAAQVGAATRMRDGPSSNEVQHVSEITPFLRATGFHHFLKPYSNAEIDAALALPNPKHDRRSVEEERLEWVVERLVAQQAAAHRLVEGDEGAEVRKLGNLSLREITTTSAVNKAYKPLRPL